MTPGHRYLAVIGGCLAVAAPALAAEELLEGLQAEPSSLVTLARVALGVWGAVLVLSGRPAPRLTVGSFAILAGLAVAWPMLAATSYLLTIAGAALVLAAGLAVHAVAPRLAMALAMTWPLPAAYVAHVALGGGFTQSQAALLCLAAAGAAIGALAPDAAAGMLGAALGTVMLAVAWPGPPRFWPWFVLFVVGTLWQLALSMVVRPPLVPPRPNPWRVRVRRSLAAGVGGAGVLLAVLLLVVVLAPRPEAEGAAHAARLAALRKATNARGAIVLTAANGFYLFGRALPVTLVADGGTLADRLAVLASGRSCSRELAGLRTVKDAGELAALRRAAAITASAFRAAAPLIRAGANERDLEAAILGAFRAGGATGVAFKSVIGSGPNAVLPHYQRNDAELRAGLVVVDIGCSVDGYASDITRTFPVSGEWSKEQRQLLDAVLAAKREAGQALRPGASLRALNRSAHASIAAAGFGEYFIHGLSHHVGIDVHDSKADTLAEDMVVTIEPGIYIPAGAAVDRAYWDLGIRVEDTYLVTKDGGVPLAELPEVLPSGSGA
jgi:Xaa-Pro aminopeptidase